MRSANIERVTNETNINMVLNLDGGGKSIIKTNIPFFDHMLTLFSRHSLIDLNLKVRGDVEVDYHHTVEDSGIVLGECLRDALGDKSGITRYGHAYVPMDETLSRIVVDCSNRPYLVWKVAFTQKRLGEMDTELFKEWFQAFSQALGANIHVENLYGTNNHHIIESCYKGLARSLRDAVQLVPRISGKVPSTKGVLRKDG